MILKTNSYYKVYGNILNTTYFLYHAIILKIVLLRYNSYTVKFIHLKCTVLKN